MHRIEVLELDNIRHRYTIKRIVAKITSELITYDDCELFYNLISVLQF